MAKKKKKIDPPKRSKWLFGVIAAVMVGGGIATALSLPHATTTTTLSLLAHPADIEQSYTSLLAAVSKLEDRQVRDGRQVVAATQLQQSLSRIEIQAVARQYETAKAQIVSLAGQVNTWNTELDRPTAKPASVQIAYVAQNVLDLPILIYHYTPDNFGAQLQHLKDAGYHVVTLDQVAAAVAGTGGLPTKPVAITFDDGFSNQLTAYNLLRQYNDPATFYIINGGEGSRWCIGAGRRYNDPLQPPQGCGDGYLNWDEIKMLDHSGLITIGGHTIDHENLAADSPDRQRYEIIQGKTDLEAQLGHPIKHFAYPYGAYNQTTINIVREAGYQTATTTLSGTLQQAGSQYTLRRVRDALVLP